LLVTSDAGLPASPEIMAELQRLLQAATGHAGTSNINAKSETASATISADLWRQLKPGSLALAAGFDEQDNLAGWWEAIIASTKSNVAFFDH
jgi:hypothetical protein